MTQKKIYCLIFISTICLIEVGMYGGYLTRQLRIASGNTFTRPTYCFGVDFKYYYHHVFTPDYRCIPAPTQADHSMARRNDYFVYI